MMNQQHNEMPVAKSAGRPFKNDVILIVSLLLILALCATLFYGFQTDGDSVTVMVNGQLFGTYSLSENISVEIRTGENNEQINVLTIENGKAFMSYANCNGGDCIAHEPIHRNNETIACAPHRVSFIISTSNSDDSPDIII